MRARSSTPVRDGKGVADAASVTIGMPRIGGLAASVATICDGFPLIIFLGCSRRVICVTGGGRNPWADDDVAARMCRRSRHAAGALKRPGRPWGRGRNRVLQSAVGYLNSSALSLLHAIHQLGIMMVVAVSTATVSVASTSGASSTVAELKAELAAKQDELANAKSDDEKSEISSEISKLKIALAKAEQKERSGSSEGLASTSAAKGAATEPRVSVTAADRAAPESKLSGAAMDVLMRLGSQDRTASADGETAEGTPPFSSKIYAEMEGDDDGSVS
ncbi:MAG TPA: hypothetical protein VD840_04840 [Sinorhizobium sp.]|nr:hypothetical protein [Sinorhizobium sp.]